MASVTDSTYLSMTELARRLDLPESTMRYYCKRFAGFLPYKGEGRRRRYAPECENTLVFIANAMHRNKNATAVELMLRSGQYAAGGAGRPSGTAPEAPEPPALPLDSAGLLMGIMERQAEALGLIASNLGDFVSRLEKGCAPAASGGASEELRREIADLKQQMFTAEKLHQEDLEQLRKWLGRLNEAVAKPG